MAAPDPYDATLVKAKLQDHKSSENDPEDMRWLNYTHTGWFVADDGKVVHTFSKQCRYHTRTVKVYLRQDGVLMPWFS